MKNKKFLFVLLCGVLLFTLTGCAKKEALTAEKFKSIVGDEGLSIKEGDSDEKSSTVVEDLTAYNDDLSIIGKFFVYDSVSSAKSDFESSSDDIETTSNTTVSLGNYNTFEGKLKDDDFAGYDYVYMCRVDNTVILFVAKADKKEDVKKVAKALGY